MQPACSGIIICSYVYLPIGYGSSRVRALLFTSVYLYLVEALTSGIKGGQKVVFFSDANYYCHKMVLTHKGTNNTF